MGVEDKVGPVEFLRVVHLASRTLDRPIISVSINGTTHSIILPLAARFSNPSMRAACCWICASTQQLYWYVGFLSAIPVSHW